MSVLDIKTPGDVRATLHVAAPVLAAAAVASGWVNDGIAQLVVTLVLALTSATLATFNTADGFRKFFYPVIGAVGALAVALGYVNQGTWDIWIPVVTVLFGGGVAAANTPTSR